MPSLLYVARTERQVYPGHLTEITIKTFQARFLLAPNRLVNALLLGVLAMAQWKYGMANCAVVALSNHIHILCVPESARQLSRFCRFLSCNVSIEIGRLRGWSGGIFRRRYHDVVVTHEPVAQVERLRYFLSHGVKEGLVRRPQDWPGVHCAKALLHKSFEMVGKWVDRTELYEARRRAKTDKRRNRGRRPREADFTCQKVVTLSKLPCWEHLSDEQYFEEIRNLVNGILDDYEDVRTTVPRDAAQRLTRQDPEHRPASTKKSPKPVCHAASREQRRRYRELRHEWVKQYRLASESLRMGCIEALSWFPPEAFLPRLPRELAISALPP